MIALLQRASEGSVTVDGEIVGAIGPGLVALIGVQRGDDQHTAGRLLERVLGYRMFADGAGKMNKSVRDVAGGLLLIPQFTLPADTRKGLRPSFTTAAPADESRILFEGFVECAKALYPTVECGRFGERMSVALINEGPVTFWLEVSPAGPKRGKPPVS